LFAEERPGLGPLFALRNPSLRVSTFFVKIAIRPAQADKPELLAVGSGEKCPVLFSTSERDLPLQSEPGSAADACPVYTTGTPLVRGHRSEAHYLSWTREGNLVSASDDFSVRCWREDGKKARDYRRKAKEPGFSGELENAAWADVREGFDNEDCQVGDVSETS
jgi:hypothetical protein